MRETVTRAGVSAGAVLALGSLTLAPLLAQAQQPQVSYSEDIAPILQGWCVSCHQPGGVGYEASGFDLTTYEGLMQGTKFGPMVIPGEPDQSNILVLMGERVSPELRMPLGHKPLPLCLRQNVWRWIFQGAKDN
jgi:mono/diheme cytochrome c family protein